MISKKSVFLSWRRSKIIQAYCPRYPVEGEQKEKSDLPCLINSHQGPCMVNGTAG